MKIKLIIISAIAVVLFIAIGILQALNSNKNVSFTFNSDDFSVVLYSKDGKQIHTLSESGALKLKKGDYSYSVSGDGYNAKLTPFSVSEDTEIKVTSQYLKARAEKQAIDERKVVADVLSTQYPSAGVITITSFTVDTSGKWAYGTLTTQANSDSYRFIMKRDNSSWRSITPPSIALSKEELPDVPERILYSLY